MITVGTFSLRPLMEDAVSPLTNDNGKSLERCLKQCSGPLAAIAVFCVIW